MNGAATTPVHHDRAAALGLERDQLLRRARALDFRTLDRDHYNALIHAAEQAHGDAFALAGEFSEAGS